MTKTTKQLIEEHDYWTEKFKSYLPVEDSAHHRIVEALKEAAELIKLSAEGFDAPLTDWLKKNGFEE